MTRLIYFIFPFGILLCLGSSQDEGLLSSSRSAFEFLSIDTVLIENRQVGTGSKIMTDQDALVVLPPQGTLLKSIDLYFTNVSTNVSDSSRIWVKIQRSWSCAPLGNAHPLQYDQYTLGLSKNIAVQIGWNTYTFEEPIEITADSLFIWPDLIQQVKPRIPYALGNHPAIGNLTSTSCATPGMDHSVLDYACSLYFLDLPDCLPYLLITNADSTCYAADTILARTIISGGKSINYYSGTEVSLDTSFRIDANAGLLVDMSICDH